MAQNFLTGRINRFNVGVPGLSTETDLVLGVDGAIGVSTDKPRAAIDTPAISIRGEIVDASISTGGLGYFLSQDVTGVRWRAADPQNLSYITIYDDGTQIGLSSFSGINFVAGGDETFVTVTENPSDPNIADIAYDIRWVRFDYGSNKALSTSFGPDGTFWSLPGYGTSEASGITSVGIGTIQPQDDFQVGIGSTGVTINGALGKVEAELIKADNIEVDGNITVESLVVDPGIATFRGDIDAQGISSFSGPADFKDKLTGIDGQFLSLGSTFFQAGLATLGVGVGTTSTYTTILNNFESQGVIGTFAYDLYVGNDIFIGGELFVEQLNATNISISGVATVNEINLASGFATNLTIGVGTITELSFGVGIGTTAIIEEAQIGIATVGFADLTEAELGLATATQLDASTINVGFVSATDGQVGYLEVGVSTDPTSAALSVSGLSTFVGLVTVTGEVFVDGDLTVTETFTVESLSAEFLTVTGIATIEQLEFNVGIGTSASIEYAQIGVATISSLDAEDIQAGVATIGGVTIGGGSIIAGLASIRQANIGIITGDQLQYGLGTITNFNSDIANLRVAIGDTLQYSENSTINGVNFLDDVTEVTTDLNVTGIVTLGNVAADPTVGLTTVAGDLYVGNDLFVNGELNFKQLNGENLFLTGIATINATNVSSGFATAYEIESLTAGIATVTNFISTDATIVDGSFEILRVTNLGAGTTQPGQAFIDSLNAEFISVRPTGTIFTPQITVYEQLNATGDANFVGVITSASQFDFNNANGTNLTVDNLYVDNAYINNGIATSLNVGVATIQDLVVTGVTTFIDDVFIQDVVFINQEVTAISTVANLNVTGIGTIADARIQDATIGVATVGLASITRLEATSIDAYEQNIGFSTLGFASVGTGTDKSALYVTGINTFVGFTTFTGEIFVDGDLTVTGVTSFNQLDSKQSQIGILTVGQYADINDLIVSGITTFDQDIDINADINIEADIQMTGIITATSFDIIYGRVGVQTVINQRVVGVATFESDVNIENAIINTETVGISTIAFANITDEIVGTSTVTLADITSAEIDLATIGIASIGDAQVAVATVGVLSATDSYIERSVVNFETVAVSTIGLATITDLTVLNNTELNQLNVSGIATFQNDVLFFSDIDATLGTTNLLDLVVDNTANIAILTATYSQQGIATITEADIADANIGFATVGFATIGTGNSSQSALFAVGLSTFIGLTTFRGDVFIEGDLDVTGITSFNQLDAEQSQIGILTIFQYIDNQGDSSVLGFSTFQDFTAGVGSITALTVDNIDVSGIATIGELEIPGDLEVGRNLLVGGISTLGAPGPTGFTTVLGDLYIAGDLFVQDDIIYDEITGRNLSISGMATVGNLQVIGVTTTEYLNVPVSGFATVGRIEGSELQYSLGQIDELSALQLQVSGFTTTGDLVVADSISVGGTSLFVGIATFGDDVNFGANVFGAGSIDIVGSFTGDSIIVDNSIVGDDLTIQIGLANTFTVTSNLTATNIDSAGITTTNILNAGNLFVSGIGSIPIIVSDTINNSGIITTTDLIAYENATLGSVDVTVDLDVFGPLSVAGTAIFGNDIAVGGITTTTNLNVTGLGTVNNLTVSSQLTSVGITSFLSGASVYGAPLDVRGAVLAWSGIITDIQGDTLQYNTATINGVLGASTITTLDLTSTGQSDLANLQVTGISTFTNTTNMTNVVVSTNLYAEVLQFNTGFGTDLTISGNLNSLDQANLTNVQVSTAATIVYADVALAEIEQADILTANVGFASITDAEVGVITATSRVDIKDTTTYSAFKLQSTSVVPLTLSLAHPTYRSAEYTIQATSGTEIHTVRIMVASDTSATPNVFSNEYSVVTSGDLLADYEFVGGPGEIVLQITPASAALTDYMINIAATREP